MPPKKVTLAPHFLKEKGLLKTATFSEPCRKLLDVQRRTLCLSSASSSWQRSAETPESPPSISQGRGILRPWVLAQAWLERCDCCVRKGQLHLPQSCCCGAGKKEVRRQVEHEISVPKGCTYSFSFIQQAGNEHVTTYPALRE